MATTLGLIRLLYWHCKLEISRSIQYRIDFFMGIVITLSLSAIGPIVQLLIFTQTNGYPGWTLNELILFQGLYFFWIGFRDTLFGEVRPFMMKLIQDGDFDRVLLKPYTSIGIILSSGFNIQGAGSLLAGILITTYQIFKINIILELQIIIAWAILFLSGITLYLGLLTLFCSLVIIVVYAGKLNEMFDTFLRFSEYPVEVFGKILQNFFLFFVPLAVWSYHPTLLLLGKYNIIILLSASSSIIFFIFSLKIWNSVLKKYVSAGG